MPNDYYATLGVSKDASDAEIKSAYRKLAREWHPDVAKDKPDAEQKFKEINEAYNVLRDSQKRAQYDQFGSAGAGFNPFGKAAGNGPFQWSYSTNDMGGGEDPFDIFEQVFGFRGFGGGGAPRRGQNIRYSLSIDFVDAIKGFEEVINVDGHKLKVKLPPGVADGTQVRFAGKGQNPENGREPGDLFIVISINPHPEFARQGLDIFSVKDISIAEAALGTKVPIKTIDPNSKTGFVEKSMKIPAGTQSGAQIRLRGFGMQNPRGMGRGDHYITVRVEIPVRLNKQQKKALEELF